MYILICMVISDRAKTQHQAYTTLTDNSFIERTWYMEELKTLKSFGWCGSKKGRYTLDKWGNDKNCRPLQSSKSKANALLTGFRQLDSTGQYKLIAVDLDNKSNWDEVIATYQALDLPPSLTVATPSGGYHIFFWIPKSIPAQNINDDRHCKNFELKGDNSNITAPGSVFDDGAAYVVKRDVPIAKLYPLEAQRLCKYKQQWQPPVLPDDFVPDRADVDQLAHHYDERARRNARGWQIHCPIHEDRQASAVLFDSGWLWCSGCGHKQRVVNKT